MVQTDQDNSKPQITNTNLDSYREQYPKNKNIMKKLYILIILFVFSIQINAQPANNTCATATAITNVPTLSYDIYYFNDIETATTINETLCADVNPQDYVDVWFDIEMPINGNLLIDAYQNYNHIEIYDSCGGTMIDCFTEDGVVFGLTQNTTYKVRIYREVVAANYSWKQFRVRAFTPATNDDCVDSENISLSTTRTTINFDVKGGSLVNETICSDTQDYVDVWYDFTLANQSNILIASGNNYNKFVIYDACGGNEIACFDKEAIVENLVAGNYKLRMYRTSNLAFTSNYNSFTISAHESITNDFALTSENITVSNTLNTINFDPIAAEGEDVADRPSCLNEFGINYPRSVWYHFTMPFDGNLYVDGNNSTLNSFEIYNVDATVQLNCFSKNGITPNLVAGTEYKVRVFRSAYNLTNLYSTQVFTIIAYEIPSNDDCVNSVTIPLTETLTQFDFSLSGTVPNTESSCVAAGTYYDVWYDFTMPSIPSNLYIEGNNGGNKYTIYDACGGTELACFDASISTYNKEIITNLSANTSYKLRVFRVESNTGTLSGLTFENFKIRTYPKNTNTNCATSETVVVSETELTLYPNFAGADLLENQTVCTQPNNDYYDVWYSFEMPVSGNLTLTSTGYYNYYELFDTCGGTSLSCASGNNTMQNLSAGVTYKLRISRKETDLEFNPDYNSSFKIVALAIANNDTCATSENITVSETENTVNFEIISAQLNNEEGCSGSTPQNYADVWYDFTMPSFDGGAITQGNIYIDAVAPLNKISIYDTCGGTEIACFENSKMVENLISGTNYKIRVYRTETDYTNVYYKSFKITAFADSQNDDCVTSQNINVAAATSTINFEFGGAQSNLETICGVENTYVDIWYSFTLAENGSLQISNGSAYDGFELYDACAGTLIDCFITSNGSFDNLITGTNYSLRVFRPQNQNQHSVRSFNVTFQSTLGVNDESFLSQVKVYPNPTTDFVNLKFSLISEYQMELFDITGRKLVSQEFSSNASKIDMNSFANGVYFINIKDITNNQFKVIRIIKN